MVCSLDAHDVCFGCFRTLEEIGQWSRATADEQREILANVARRKGAQADRANTEPASGHAKP